LSSADVQREQEHEQEYVSRLYRRLDGLRREASARLADTLRQVAARDQDRWDREAAAARYTERLARLAAAEHGLCFGRLDMRDGRRRYIGRIGLPPEDSAGEDAEPLLIDWRAPAARPFYLATALEPHDVARRRHIKTQGRRVVEINDEFLDPDQASRAGDAPLTGETALMAALKADRTGRMGDIVATIQAEQDAVIRCDHRGVLVVQGGPGTGKTVVALHRAAYLLYTYRDLLARRGVLVVGPNPTFLSYIEDVLPGLGETGVLMSTIGGLFPGVTADGVERPEAAEIKGRAEMVDVIAKAVRDRQQTPGELLAHRDDDLCSPHPRPSAPDEPPASEEPAPGRRALEIETAQGTLLLDDEMCARARERARRTGLPHNPARPYFVDAVLDALARQAADRLNESILLPEVLAELDPDPDEEPVTDLFDEEDVAAIRQDLRHDPAVAEALEELWPTLTPQRLLADLYASPRRLASAAPRLTERERALLERDPSAPWTPADVPLLDEAAELLGEDDSAERARAAAEHRRRVAYAQGVLEVVHGSRSIDLDADEEAALTASDVVDAETLAARHEERDSRTIAERAAADRTWAFGHVIVDEAQELSPMAWRLLFRRCPGRWMTVVGDLAQTGDAAGTSSWERVLEPHVPGRWRLERLTVNYRMPAEFMDVAARVHTELTGSSLAERPRSVRSIGQVPWRAEVPAAELADRLDALVADEIAHLGRGRLAVIVPSGRAAGFVRPDPDLREQVVHLTVAQAKGLEFDSVIVVEPAEILAEGPQGPNDLFVALTRATRRLGVVHTPGGRLPAALAELPEREPVAS